MRTGRPIPPLTLTRSSARRWSAARRAKTAQAVAQRARLILGCAAGKTNTVVAHELRLTKQTVGKWRTRFLSRRLDGLRRAPARRPADDHRCAGRARADADPRDNPGRRHALEHAVDGSGRGLSRSAVHRIWRAFGCGPIAPRRSSFRRIRSLSRRCAILSACTSSPRIARWCCAWTRSPKSRRSIGPSRSCRCGRAKPSGGPTTTRVTARPRCSPRSTPRPGR